MKKKKNVSIIFLYDTARHKTDTQTDGIAETTAYMMYVMTPMLQRSVLRERGS